MDSQSTHTLNTGNKMPVLGLGTWQLNKDTAGTIAKALAIGYKMIDTSGDYGTQPGIGEGIKESGFNRDSFYLVTKVEEHEDAYESTLKNLEELDLEYADLILIHRPPRSGAGENLWQGLIKAKQDGLTEDIGVSNYSEEQIDDLIADSGEIPVVNQIEWSPFGHSQDMLGFCQEKNIIIQAYSPLTRTDRLDDVRLKEIAASYNKTPAQILLRWNIQLGTAPLPKANSLEHMKENLGIFDFEISQENIEALSQLNEQYSSLGALPYV